MKHHLSDSRIPMRPGAVIPRGRDCRYIVEEFCFGTRYALAYRVHAESEPQHSFSLLELYPHAGVRMGNFAQRLDSGTILIHNPFHALFGPDDEQLVQTYCDELLKELPPALRPSEPEWFTDRRGCHYLVLDPHAAQPAELTIPGPLSGIPADELASYLLLHKHPLYRYREENGDIHVLCLGSGVFMHRMILSVLSCGQIPNTQLHIHIVSNNSREEFADRLLSAAPLLASYVDLGQEGQCPGEYAVKFHYRQVSDALAPDVLSDLPYARYILISLGDHRRNAAAAGALARQAADNPAFRDRDTVINYYCPEKWAAISVPRLPNWLVVDPFSEDLSGYRSTLQDLARLTVRFAHMYDKLSSPKISLAETAAALEKDAYNQKSSCVSALHLYYKLAGIGIDPQGTPESIIPAYLEALQDERYNLLLANEHSRWIYFMMADGYGLPSEEELFRYGFAYHGETFNGSWKCIAKRLHPCLVPCSNNGVVLTTEDFRTCSSREAIDSSAFDELDKVSLRLHLFSREKCDTILKDQVLESSFKTISQKLSDSQDESADLTLQNLQEKLKEAETIVCARARSLRYGSHKELDELLWSFQSENVDIAEEITSLKNQLRVFIEYNSHKDYKKGDETIVKNLLWVLYGGYDLKLIMLCNQTIAARITTPLLTDPSELVFFGSEENPDWKRFLHNHGCRGQISFVPCPEDASSLRTALQHQIARMGGRCTIDISSADAVAATAAQQLCQENADISLICATDDDRIENIRNFPLAPIYSLKTALTAEDIFTLHGAGKAADESHYMEKLSEQLPALWSLYREYQDKWNMISGFFASPKTKPQELYISGLTVSSDTEWNRPSYELDAKKWRFTHMEDCLRTIEAKGLLRNLQIKDIKSGKNATVEISFLFPRTPPYAEKALNKFFSKIFPKASAPYACTVQENDKGWSISISSGRKACLEDNTPTFRDANRNTYPYSEIIPVLKRMQEKNLIKNLSYNLSKTNEISFDYTHAALRSCLLKAGNLLEFYIYGEAKKTGFFQDIQSNFVFAWKDENVTNELDVVLTSGLKNLFVSAKSGIWKKEHLYEIKYLTDRFSVNSIPVIVYSSDRAYEDGDATKTLLALKQRAQAMGVYLIALKELNGSLGEHLVKIAKGEVSP